MKLLGTILFMLAITGYATIIEQEVRTTFRLSSARREELRRKLEAAGGCNANVCFGIDGSDSISSEAFLNEKNFVLDVVSVIAINHTVNLAALQYSIPINPISPLTGDYDDFSRKVNGAEQAGGLSFVGAGVSYCISQLFPRPSERKKIVLLADGRTNLNIGSSTVARANFFRKLGGSISAVAAGHSFELYDLLGINPLHNFNSNLLEVDDFLDVLGLNLLIEDLVSDICGVKLR